MPDMPPIRASDFTCAEMRTQIGASLGTSAWHEITQTAVNAFAEYTLDPQWIHVDVERAAQESPFGGPVAHGFLTLSLVAGLATQIGIAPRGTKAALNYGLDKVRFLSPVRVGSSVRLHVTLTDFENRSDGSYLMHTENILELPDAARPALIAKALVLLVPDAD